MWKNFGRISHPFFQPLRNSVSSSVTLQCSSVRRVFDRVYARPKNLLIRSASVIGVTDTAAPLAVLE